MELTDFESVIRKYRVVFFDAYGVLKTSHSLIPGIESTIEYLNEHGKRYFILTNDASKSPEQIAQSYHALGLKSVQPESIVSAGLLATEYLRLKPVRGTVAYLGTSGSAYYIEAAGMRPLPVIEAGSDNIETIEALAFMDDDGFDWKEGMNKTVNLLRKKTIPVIVANTDEIYPVDSHEVGLAIGSLAKMAERVTGLEFMRFGKPDTQMFLYAYQKVLRSQNISRNEILMVGDTIQTDISGGNKFGLDTALVLTGNTRKEFAESWIKETGVRPTYLCASAAVR